MKSSELRKFLQENEAYFQKLSKIQNEHDTKEGKVLYEGKGKQEGKGKGKSKGKGKGKTINYYLSALSAWCLGEIFFRPF